MTILQQGRFTADGTAETLVIRSDVDWLRVYNTTIAAANQTTAVGVEYYWQRGFAADTGWEYLKSNAANAANLSQMLTSGGFTLQDTSVQTPGALNATGTAITDASPAAVALTSTTGLVGGDVVRAIDVAGMQQIAGMEFTIDTVVANTSFNLSYLDASGFAAAGTTCSFRRIPFDPIYSPRRRYITGITAAASAVVTMSVTHGYSVGELIRFKVNSDNGMVEMNDLIGEITAVSTANNTITVNIDSSAFTAFSFPTSAEAAAGYTPAQAVPLGDEASVLSGATDNEALIGIELAAGTNSPAGATSDVIYWVAGKSFSVTNE